MTKEGELAIALGIAEPCWCCGGKGMIFACGGVGVVVRPVGDHLGSVQMIAHTDVAAGLCDACGGTGAVPTRGRMLVD